MGTILLFLHSVRPAINEKLLEAEVPVIAVHFSASVHAIFFVFFFLFLSLRAK